MHSLVGRYGRREVELVLNEDGTFSFDGIWGGYEVTRVSGTWSRRDGYIHLTGTGWMHADFGRFSDRAFGATFSQREDGAVVSETSAPGWSLLDTREPLLPVLDKRPRLTDQLDGR